MGFTCRGHSGYAEAGGDIVCASVSVLVINTINSIERFTQDEIRVEERESDGVIDVRFVKAAGERAALLLDSMVLGLQEVEKQYGNRYLRLHFEEV